MWRLQLGKAMAHWLRYERIAVDEIRYVSLARLGAEFLFRVIAECAEKAVMMTNLFFPEWTRRIANAIVGHPGGNLINLAEVHTSWSTI